MLSRLDWCSCTDVIVNGGANTVIVNCGANEGAAFFDVCSAGFILALHVVHDVLRMKGHDQWMRLRLVW